MDNRISHIEIFRYRIPLSSPLTTSRDYHRSGIILFLYDKYGHCGAGEIAPLEGLSRETLGEALKQVVSISDVIKGAGLDSIDSSRLFPSVRFGLELATLTLKANQTGIPVWKELDEKEVIKRGARIRISALIPWHSNSEEELLDLMSKGYNSFKIKANRIEDARLINSLRQMGGNGIDIIIDANKAFSLEEGIRFGRSVYPSDIRYIEDPLKEIYKLKEFSQKTGISIGIDQDINNRDIREGDHIKAWVIKPGIVAGLRETITLIKEALKKDITPVLSNPFYSGIGVCALILLASAHIPEHIPMGLDPYRWIKEDILEEPLDFKNGSFSVEDASNKIQRINKSLLHKIC